MIQDIEPHEYRNEYQPLKPVTALPARAEWRSLHIAKNRQLTRILSGKSAGHLRRGSGY